MKIGEIADAGNVNISVIENNTSISLNSIVAFSDGTKVYAYPFFKDGKVYEFNSRDAHLELMNLRQGESPVFWKNVSVVKTVYEGDVYHCITSDVEGVVLNRRNSFRVAIAGLGSVMELTDGERIEASMRDVSESGISFITSKGVEPKFDKGTHVHIQFSDEEVRFNIDVTARIVRAESTQDGVIYGCTFTRTYPQVKDYVTNKLK